MKKIFTLAAAACFAGLSASAQTSYTLRTLTFEDKDYQGTTPNFAGASNWSSLIDEPQYGGSMLYGDGGGVTSEEEAYTWTDEHNTWLSNTLSEGYGTWCYWSGGHAISNYVSSDIETYGGFNAQLTVYKANDDKSLFRTGGGHNGSDNFAVHYGYADNSGFGLGEDALPVLKFADGEARVIDHMYVNNTCYALNCYYNGNGLTANIGEDDWVALVATGYNGDEKTGSVKLYLCNGPKDIITDWTKFDLFELGKVTKVTFNVTGSSDNGYGFSQPAYFAYDDVAVRFDNNDDHTDATVATFDDLTLEPESSWYGPADNAVEGTDDYGSTVWNGTFKSGAYEFVNSINPVWGSWTGCSYSNMTATTFSDYSTDQWNSCVGHGATGSANYGVIYCGMPAGMPMEVIKVLDAPEGRVINGLNLTNSAWVVECVKNGNGVAKKFEQGSWFKVTFTGTKADNTTASVDYYLADYRSENEADWTCLTDWDWLDLSSLGKVVSLSVSFDGSDKAYGYMNTSTYVCIDNVGCTKNTPTAIATAKPNYVELHEVARYTLDGKRINAPQKGVNIIRMSDGSTRKVVVK